LKLPKGASAKIIEFKQPSRVPSITEINDKPKRWKALSFFSGCGGGSTGLKWAGFDVLYANEFVPNAAKNYKLNSPSTIVDTRDIRKVTGKSILKKLGLKRGQVDLIEASPPCKGFSSTRASKKGSDFGVIVKYSEGIKQRIDDLFFEFLRIADEIKPKVFVMENVDGLANHVNKGILVEILDNVERIGYTVEARILDLSLLGWPQRRKRMIFVCVRNDLVKKGFKPVFPKPAEKEATVASMFPYIERIRIGSGFVSPDRASPCITASDHSIGFTARFSCGGWIETRNGYRRYTIQELKRMFGFPDDFQLKGSFIQQWERLGRSHAPPQMYKIAKTIEKHILLPWANR
jgi:DNA (cytosine-5)-methyltransferase 1